MNRLVAQAFQPAAEVCTSCGFGASTLSETLSDQPLAAGALQSLSVTIEFAMGEHSIHGISNFSRHIHADKVSDKACDKESKINPSPNSKMSKLQAWAGRPCHYAGNAVAVAISFAAGRVGCVN